MTRTDYTHIAFLLDRSGSMETIRDDAIGGFNRLVKDQAVLSGHCTFTLVQFDCQDPDEVVFDMVQIAKVPELTKQRFSPRGSTPLLDAMAGLIIRTGDKLRDMPEADRPGKVIVAILTDGLENASRKYTRQQVFDMITHQREVYGWEFIFLGANQDAIGEAKKYGIDVKLSSSFSATPEGTQKAFKTSADYMRALREEQEKLDGEVSEHSPIQN